MSAFRLAIAALLLAQASMAQDQDEDRNPIARTRLEPGPAVTVGQPIDIDIEVLVPAFFMGAPRYPDLDVDDALTLFNARGTNFSERIDGETWAGQSRRYTVYPQRAGTYEIAEIPSTLSAHGVVAGELDALADGVLKDPDLVTNPVQLNDKARVLEILEARL